MPSLPLITLLSSPQTVTVSWVDIGSEINSGMSSDIGFWVKMTINNSANVEFRYLAKHTADHADEYEIMVETITAGVESEDPIIHEVNRDIDQKIFYHFPISGEIPFIQMQVKALTVGDTGATIDEVKYNII